ncbi:MarR family transcriptional regulator [Actinacidiphila bryophytorum]|uniref:MarR family transcriptional regulator n=2 Tax=Actinacidiphila bryophytorum TaxID=1436133 RepID=A0A9W4H1N0_9ACTN|nr:MarR family transcriptional regulator [Actinacidiphila bryophytorum]
MPQESQQQAPRQTRQTQQREEERAGAGAVEVAVDADVMAFIERFAAQLVEAGMPRMPSRVFAALLVSPDGALSSAALADQLQISPAAVSGAVRYLAQAGLILRERDPGSRRELYRLHNDQWFETFTNREHMLVRWESTLRTGVYSVGEDSDAGRRLAETAAFFEFLQRELTGMMERWRVYRTTL